MHSLILTDAELALLRYATARYLDRVESWVGVVKGVRDLPETRQHFPTVQSMHTALVNLEERLQLLWLGLPTTGGEVRERADA